MYRPGINLTFMVAMVSKKNRLKIGKLPFWNKFETFDREVNMSTSKYQNYILTDDQNYMYHGTEHIFFFVFSCADTCI